MDPKAVPTVSNSSLNEVVSALPQQAQRQDSLNAQLKDLRIIANRLGMYDAADYLRTVLEQK